MNTTADSVRRNVLSAAAIQGASIGLPLLLIPYLARVLGIELFGVVAFGLALVQVMAVVTDSGSRFQLPT